MRLVSSSAEVTSGFMLRVTATFWPALSAYPKDYFVLLSHLWNRVMKLFLRRLSQGWFSLATEAEAEAEENLTL